LSICMLGVKSIKGGGRNCFNLYVVMGL